MSRSTQYIGLTDAAEEWVKGAIGTEQYPMTRGMFDEPIMGTIYHMPAPEGPNKELIAKEVVQAEPWSSGPMIFTHLELILVKECGQMLKHGFIYSWVEDPTCKSEFNSAKGVYWV